MGESLGRTTGTRTVVLGMQVSLDGFVATVDGGLDWIWPHFDDALRAALLASVRQVSTHVMGRYTYLAQAAHWPTSNDEVAPYVNEAEKVVFSRTLARVDWQNARLAGADLARELDILRRRDGGTIAITGGARLAQSAARLGVVDEYHLVIHPVALGAGLPLFADLDHPLQLCVVDTEKFDTGVVRTVMRPRRS